MPSEGLPLEPFTVHDMRRTGSTLLNELGFNSDWIEKCLAHEDGRSSRGVYNKAEYEHQRRHMMQEWSDIIDAWVVLGVGVVAFRSDNRFHRH
jgi:integrase